MEGKVRRGLVVGNWKMHGALATNAELLAQLQAGQPYPCDTAVCVPFPYLGTTAATLDKSSMRWGAQDCSAHEQGAYTGEVSAAMLREFGCRYAIVGHSERRALHGETDAMVGAKAAAALAHGIVPIVCVGETLAQRSAGETEIVVQRQLDAVVKVLGPRIGDCVMAYEPVWAIGTGRTASPVQAQAVHALLRKELCALTPKGSLLKILYGGSVKPENATLLFAEPDIDGALVGGASLKAADFIAICRAMQGEAAVDTSME